MFLRPSPAVSGVVVARGVPVVDVSNTCSTSRHSSTISIGKDYEKEMHFYD